VKVTVAASALWISIAGTAVADPLHVVVPGGPIAPGERVQLHAVPPPGPADREGWTIVSGPGAMQMGGRFKAPYVVPPGGAVTEVQVCRGPRGAQVCASAELQLREGSFPGADSCAGPGQAGLPNYGEGVLPDELPEAVTKVPAEYTASARARGIEGVVLVIALVCQSGRVLDAYALPYSSPDPALEAAAVDAARQWVFKPALLAGQPLAVWVNIPFRFPPP